MSALGDAEVEPAGFYETTVVCVGRQVHDVLQAALVGSHPTDALLAFHTVRVFASIRHLRIDTALISDGPPDVLEVLASFDEVLDNPAVTTHEMLTTANFCVGNRFLTWYCGGLNHQIEHHLFPKTCSVHYPAISVIVREVAEEHGIPYHHNPTFSGAFGSHLKMLRRLGAAEQVDLIPAEIAAD